MKRVGFLALGALLFSVKVNADSLCRLSYNPNHPQHIIIGFVKDGDVIRALPNQPRIKGRMYHYILEGWVIRGCTVDTTAANKLPMLLSNNDFRQARVK